MKVGKTLIQTLTSQLSLRVQQQIHFSCITDLSCDCLYSLPFRHRGPLAMAILMYAAVCDYLADLQTFQNVKSGHFKIL